MYSRWSCAYLSSLKKHFDAENCCWESKNQIGKRICYTYGETIITCPILGVASRRATESEEIMKNFMTKASTVVAALALVVTTVAVNSACVFFMHQPELPEGADSLRHE